MSPRANQLTVRALVLLIGLIMATASQAQTPPAPLVLEAKIPLGSVSGRIDHLAVDLKRKRLFVAELGNDSLGIVDLANGKVVRTLIGRRAAPSARSSGATDRDRGTGNRSVGCAANNRAGSRATASTA